MPYYRRNLYILSTTIFLTCVSWNQVMPFLPLFMKEMGIKENLLGWVGWVYALQSAASIVAMPFWGKLGDKYGRKPMAVRAGLCLGLIYFGMSLCQTPLQLAILRFLNGALTGFIPSSMALIGTNTPEDEAPRAIAVAQTASAAGLIIGPAIGGVLAALIGYRGSMLLSGTLVLLSALAVFLFVQERQKAVAGEPTSLVQDFGIALRSRVLSSVMFTVMITGIFGAALSPILALHLSEMNKNLPDWFTGLVFSLSPAAMFLTAYLWARSGERWGFHRTIQVGLLGGALMSMALTLVHSVWTFSVVFFVTGMFLAAINPSTGSIICTRVDQTFRGRAYGMQSSATMFGTVIGPFLATSIGALYGIRYVFLVVGGVLLIGYAGFGLLVRRWDAESSAEPSQQVVLEPALEADIGGE